MANTIGGYARIALAAAILLGMAACESSQPMTRTGEVLDHAGTVTGNAVGHAGEVTGNAVSNAGGYVKNKVD